MKKIIIISMLGIAAMILAAHGIFAADTYTPHYNLRLPDLDIEDEETPWGEKYNNNFSLIDSGLQSLKTSTSSLTSDVAALKVSTGAIQAQLNAVAVSTGALYNEKLAKAGDTMTGQLTMDRSSITWTNGGSIENVNRVLLNTSFADGCTEGALQWNMEDGTAEICMQSGQIQLQIGQELLFKAKMVGTAGLNGQVVAITGASGQRPEIELADADAANVRLQDCVIGVLTENVNQNANGFFNAYGYVRDINTSAFSDGDKVYLSTTAGSFIKTIPSPPAKVIPVGIVIYAHATSGILFVHITNIPSQIVTSSVTVSELYAGTATFSGPVSGISLSEIEDLTADKTFSMANKTLTWNFTNPSGGMTWNFTGAAAGHSLEIMQSGGNPGADMHMLHVQASDTDPTTLHLVPGATTSRALMIHSSGDTTTNPGRMEIAGDGKITWGTGSGATDTNLYRAAADTLKTDDSVIVAGSATISGPLTLNGSSLTVTTGDQSTSRIGVFNTGTNGEKWQFVAGIPATANGGLSIHNITDNATRIYIDGSGNVGVGTTSPGELLDVNGTAKIQGSSFSVGTSTLVVSNGRVGVGTNNPQQNLSVVGTNASIGVGSDDGLFLQENGAIGEVVGFNPTVSNFNAVGLRATSGTQLYLNTDGNVGIGTTAPQTKIHISSGTLTIDGNSTPFGNLATTSDNGVEIKYTNPTGTLRIGQERSGGGAIMTGSIGGAGVITTSGNYPIQIGANDVARMTFLTNGNVGIGNTAPATKLHVSSGTVYIDGTNGSLNIRSGSVPIFSAEEFGASGWASRTTDGANTRAGWGFINDADVGLYRPSTNELGFLAGSEIMRLTSMGLGIGATSPKTQLHVSYSTASTSGGIYSGIISNNTNGTTGTTAGILFNTTVAANIGKQYIGGVRTSAGSGVGDIIFALSSVADANPVTFADEKMRILANGNVGLGDTAPTAKLVVSGNIVSSGTIYAQNGFYGSGVNLSGVGALVSSVTVSVATGTITFSGLDGNSAGVYYMVFASSTGTGGMGYRLNFNGDATSTNYVNAQTNNNGSGVGASSDNSDKLFVSAIALGTPMDADGHIKIYRGGNGHIFATGDAVFSDGTSGIWTQNARLVHHSAQTNITSISFLVNNNGFPVGTRVELYRSR